MLRSKCRLRLLRPQLSQGSGLSASSFSSSNIRSKHSRQHRRGLVTLAIETSCDDTAVAILSRTGDGQTSLLFNERISSDNRAFRGINPTVAVQGHNGSLAPLLRKALASLPDCSGGAEEGEGEGARELVVGRRRKKVPDFVSVTRGPGNMANLSVGLNAAKGLAVAWGVPLVGVHHMQAHALTPRLVRALEKEKTERSSESTQGTTTTAISTPARERTDSPEFPFLSLLVSGGHTQLVHSASLNDHRIVATTGDVAIGNMLDQTARVILPAAVLEASPDVMYGRTLEAFAFPPGSDSTADYEAFFQPATSRHAEIGGVASGYSWAIPLPFRDSRKLAYSFSGIYTNVHRIVSEANTTAAAAAAGGTPTTMSDDERRALARHTLRAAFQHLVSRLVLALEDRPELREAQTLVIAGGVASNRFLKHVLRTTLQARGFGHLDIVVPPVELCTDNAAMIAWTGMEMYEAGFHSDLSILPVGKWPMDPEHGDGSGILGIGGWLWR